MKNLFRGTVAAAALLAFVGGAQAADLMDAPTGYWSGFYVGGQVGYYDATWDFPGGGPDFDAGDGVSLGGYAGVNYEMNNNLVVGIEGDYNAAFGDDVVGGPPFQIGSFGSIRARIGYAMDATLIYVTGGLALIDGEASFSGPPDPGFEIGYAVGGGVEHFLNSTISAKLEYLYMASSDFGPPALPPGTDLEMHTVRAGVAFHF